MSLIDLASMVLAPTAVKDGKVYNAIPNDQDFTFSRGTEATRVNSAGLIEKARTNFLLQSNTFDTTWTTANASVTGGQADKDGGTDAWLLQATTTGSSRRVYQSVSIGGGIKNLSVYAKAGTTSFIAIEGAGSNGFYSYFNLSTGTKGTYGGSVVATSIESVGSGWYRISVSGNPISLSLINLLVTDGDNSTAVTSGANVYIQDAQLEAGLVSTDVITTTTSSVTVGITDDLPRVDYSGGGCPSLLLESQRTNSYTNSEYFDDWLSNRLDRTANNIISPEGVQNAYKMAQQSGFTTAPNINKGGIAAGTYTVSIFAKKGSWNYLAISFQGVSYFNLEAGSKGTINSNHTATIEDYGNGWYRCAITRTTTTTQTPAFYFAESDNTLTTPDTQGYIYAYGAMLEAGSYVSSYIPTYGTSTSRSADSCSLTNASNLIGQTEGTIYIETTPLNDVTTYTERLIKLVDGGSDLIGVNRYGNSSLNYYGGDSGGTQWSFNVANVFQGNVKTKIAIAYKQNDIVIYINGIQKGTDTSANVPTTNTIYFANDASGGLTYVGKHSQAILFPTRLTNDQLAELTK